MLWVKSLMSFLSIYSTSSIWSFYH